MYEIKGAPGEKDSRGETNGDVALTSALTSAVCEMTVVDRQHPQPVRRMGRKQWKILYLFKWPHKTQLSKTMPSTRMSAGAV